MNPHTPDMTKHDMGAAKTDRDGAGKDVMAVTDDSGRNMPPASVTGDCYGDLPHTFEQLEDGLGCRRCMTRWRKVDSGWPAGVRPGDRQRIASDNGDGTHLIITVGQDGDANVAIWTDEGGSVGVRVCSSRGGGRNVYTRVALLHVLHAMQLDTAARTSTSEEA